MAVKDYKTNPDENTTISGINIAEGCPPSGINNAIRQLMADVKQNADDQNTEFSKLMTGATDSASGASGNVPAPKAGEQNYLLRGNGTWTKQAPSAYQADRDSEGNIIKDSYLKKTGGTVNGTTVFETSTPFGIKCKSTTVDIAVTPDENRYIGIDLLDKNDKRIAYFGALKRTDGSTDIEFQNFAGGGFRIPNVTNPNISSQAVNIGYVNTYLVKKSTLISDLWAAGYIQFIAGTRYIKAPDGGTWSLFIIQWTKESANCQAIPYGIIAGGKTIDCGSVIVGSAGIAFRRA